MRKAIAVLGSAPFFAVAPSSVAGLVPWWITRWEFRPPFVDLDATRAVGILLIVAGLPGLVDSFARFALQGLGTLAPIAPTQNLVVTGCAGPNSVLLLGVGARVDLRLEAVALVQVEQPDRAQHRNRFRHGFAFLGGTRAEAAKERLGKRRGNPQIAAVGSVSR